MSVCVRMRVSCILYLSVYPTLECNIGDGDGDGDARVGEIWRDEDMSC